MSQFYLNGPSVGGAISAEEFAAMSAGRLPDQSFAQRANDGAGTGQCSVCQPCQPPVNGCVCGCDCGGTTPDCPDDCGQGSAYCQQKICCCRPASGSAGSVTTPDPQPPQVDEGCCCKQSFRAALSLLCGQQISSLLDFDAAAFLTDTYAAGATITPITPPADGAAAAPDDNLGATLTGSFRRFAPCGCDLLDVDAEISTAAGTAVGLTARQVSLCQLAAVVIQIAAAAAEGDLSADEVTARNFRCVRQRLAQRLNSSCGCGCGQEQSSCSCGCDGEDCCCAAGLLNALSQNNLSRRVSLVAGVLALQNVTLLGTVGNVLVLSNDTDNRLYFVCVNSVQFIG